MVRDDHVYRHHFSCSKFKFFFRGTCWKGYHEIRLVLLDSRHGNYTPWGGRTRSAYKLLQVLIFTSSNYKNMNNNVKAHGCHGIYSDGGVVGALITEIKRKVAEK